MALIVSEFDVLSLPWSKVKGMQRWRVTGPLEWICHLRPHPCWEALKGTAVTITVKGSCVLAEFYSGPSL
jgi:hypothetical protein